METFELNNKKYKVFEIEAFGNKEKVIIIPEKYLVGNILDLMVFSLYEDPVSQQICPEAFGVLTVNLRNMHPDKGFSYVKNYSENSGWAEDLAQKIGGRDTGKSAQTGFVTVPLYDFTKIDIYA